MGNPDEKIEDAKEMRRRNPKTLLLGGMSGRYSALVLMTAMPLATIACRGDPQRQTQDSDAARASRSASPGPILDGNRASHERMLATLKRIAERTPEENPYLQTSLAQSLRERAANLAPGASASVRYELYIALGVAELHLGNLRAAITNLERARHVIAETDAKLARWATFQLGVAYMRLGETQNCCLRHTSESCILPIQGKGLHTDPEGSKAAIQYFEEVLRGLRRGTFEFAHVRWLYNIAHMTLGLYPQGVAKEYLVPPRAFKSEASFPRFTNVAPGLGLGAMNLSGGAIVDDFDNDDDLDIVTSTWDPTDGMHFWQNNGDGTFSDRTSQAGLDGLYGGLNLEQADYNNDGHLDILVLRGGWISVAGQHPNSLLRNNGNGTFTDVTFDAGLGEVAYPTQTGAWADFDNDGDLDLFVGNESIGSYFPQSYLSTKGGAEFGAPCQLFRNNGDGTFTDVSIRAGVENFQFTKGVTWGDYNNDRYPDLYVSNMGAANRLYRNNTDGTFTDVASTLGVTRPRVSFPTWFWDFNNDGVLDIFVSTYAPRAAHVAIHYLGHRAEFEPACLYRGNGRGGFTEVGAEQNLIYPMLTMGSNFGDLNNDGYPDMYLGTGDPDYASLVPNVMFLNREGNGFADVTMSGGFGHLQKGHGVVFADIDNDGDLDVFEQMGGAFPGDKFSDALYENPGFGAHWVTIKLIGVESNRSAIGARIHARIVENGKERSVFKHVNSGGSFGANPLRQTLGLGQAATIKTLEIFWPKTGRTQTFRNVKVNRAIQIVEGEDRLVELNVPRFRFKSGSKSTSRASRRQARGGDDER